MMMFYPVEYFNFNRTNKKDNYLLIGFSRFKSHRSVSGIIFAFSAVSLTVSVLEVENQMVDN